MPTPAWRRSTPSRWNTDQLNPAAGSRTVLTLPCLPAQKRLDRAKEVYLQGIERCPDSPDLHNNYGVFLVDTGQFDETTAPL